MSKKMESDWIEERKPPPHDKAKWVRIIALIRNNKTREIRRYESEAIWDDDEAGPSTYIWSEGNFSCDCNRQIFFDQAAGDESEESCLKCGNDKFSVNLENPKDSAIFYREYGRKGARRLKI